MTRGPTRKPTPPIGMAELGELLGWRTERARRTVLKLYKLRPGPWLVTSYDEQNRLRYKVNLSLLRAAWPGMFEASSLAGDADERLLRIEERVGVLEKRSRAHGAALRIITKLLKDADA